VKNAKLMQQQSLLQQRSQNKTQTITSQNTINALAIANNSIVSKQDLADCMSTPVFQGCTKKEKRQILEVLEILHDKGYHTPQAIQTFVMKEYKTIQHFEQQIKSYPISAMRAIASSTKPKKYDPKNENRYKDEHINNCIEALFNILICKDDAVITPQVLACNPLFQSSGFLKVWSIGGVVECDEGRTQFGVPSSQEGATMRQWTPMQDEAMWKKLVEVISTRFIEALNAEHSKGGFSPPEHEELATYWDNKLDEGERLSVIDELCSELAAICRRDHAKGWYNLTNMLAKNQKCLESFKIKD